MIICLLYIDTTLSRGVNQLQSIALAHVARHQPLLFDVGRAKRVSFEFSEYRLLIAS